MNLQQGMKVILTTGETFIVDNDMKSLRSCTVWDVYRFQEEGLLKEVKHMNVKVGEWLKMSKHEQIVAIFTAYLKNVRKGGIK